jgi:hypothetical protein
MCSGARERRPRAEKTKYAQTRRAEKKAEKTAKVQSRVHEYKHTITTEDTMTFRTLQDHMQISCHVLRVYVCE